MILHDIIKNVGAIYEHFMFDKIIFLQNKHIAKASLSGGHALLYHSTVTLLARVRGLSMSQPFIRAV